jgi:hypothetical protein
VLFCDDECLLMLPDHIKNVGQYLAASRRVRDDGSHGRAHRQSRDVGDLRLRGEQGRRPLCRPLQSPPAPITSCTSSTYRTRSAAAEYASAIPRSPPGLYFGDVQVH